MKKTTNLGKGLGELLGDSFPNMNTEKNIIDIEIASIIPGKYQPRMKVAKDDLAELAESIKTKGVIQPILVKSSTNANKYEIIAGERRYLASIKARKSFIPAIILDIDDKTAYEFALIENIQREQLNPLEEATAINKLINKYSYSQDSIAKQLGKSRAHIANVLRLLLLPQEIQDMVGNNQLTMGHARALVKKDNAIELANDIINNNLSVREVEKIVKTATQKKRKKLIIQHDQQKKIYLDQLSKKLATSLAHKVKIKQHGKKGEIIIAYNNLDGLNHLVNILTTNVSRET